MADETKVIDVILGPYRGHRLTVPAADADSAVNNHWATDANAPPPEPDHEPHPPLSDEERNRCARRRQRMGKANLGDRARRRAARSAAAGRWVLPATWRATSPANTPRARPRRGAADGRARKPGADHHAAPEGQPRRRGQLSPRPVHGRRRNTAVRVGAIPQLLANGPRPDRRAGLLDGRGVRVGLHPRHRATARLPQARTGRRRHRNRHHLGAVASVAGAERLPDAVAISWCI